MSLQKVETLFGPKTQVHQSSCNQDRGCLAGDCPSFVTVRTAEGTGIRKPEPPQLDREIPEPEAPARLEQPYHIYAPGVGGTGVLTLNAILAQAAAMDGKRVLSYDQTGAAQKWGAVLSSVILAEPEHAVASNKIGLGKADLYLALDLMAAADAHNLDRCDPQKTVAVINTSLLPSGEMIRDVRFSPAPFVMTDAIQRYTRPERDVCIEARAIAEDAFGDYLMTNMVALGAAFQAGLIPIRSVSIEAAIRLNGVAVENNVLAFRYGRLAYHNLAALRALIGTPAQTLADRTLDTIDRLSTLGRKAHAKLLARCAGLDDESRRLLAPRIADLIEYQNFVYAARYVNVVLRGVRGTAEIAHAVIINLHKLMAYKDEYEVARLLSNSVFQTRVRERFVAPRSVEYNLHPPLLRALGMKKKVRLGAWFTPVLSGLAKMKYLRGTPFDPFGAADVRRVERALIDWYVALVETVVPRLTPGNAAQVLELLELPDEIRGYENVKMQNVESALNRANELLAGL
ncbi:MAG: 2-oxoacid:acceptor oxidoreductase family protein [Candidatus Eremiobacteraeota bacterium]|nr:2-oxoacid:acceptor oxidoreductase family protein [Candidatus Eremiobacteraeota bacterium]